MEIKNVLLIAAIFVGLISGAVFLRKEPKVGEIPVFCSVFNDSSMICNPIDRTGGRLWVFRTPCMEEAVYYIMCNYSIDEKRFVQCIKMNISIEK